MPAAGWAARTGSPVLYTTRDALPEVTQLAIRAHNRPRIYVLGGEDAIGAEVERALARLGRVTRVAGADATTTSIAAARLARRGRRVGRRRPRPRPGVRVRAAAGGRRRGGAAVDLGHLRAPARAPAGRLASRSPLRAYLLDIQPGYRENPVRGVYNHGWIVGDRTAVPLATQSAIDALLEISPVRTQ